MTISAHGEFVDQIPAYLAGGLTQEERRALEAHLSVCAACNLALEEAAKTDHAMQELFAAVRPAAGFEDKLIEELRIAPARRKIFSMQPAAWRLLSGIAATLALAAVGYAMGGLIETNHLPYAAKMSDKVKPQFASKLGAVSEQKSLAKTMPPPLGNKRSDARMPQITFAESDGEERKGADQKALSGKAPEQLRDQPTTDLYGYIAPNDARDHYAANYWSAQAATPLASAATAQGLGLTADGYTNQAGMGVGGGRGGYGGGFGGGGFGRAGSSGITNGRVGGEPVQQPPDFGLAAPAQVVSGPVSASGAAAGGFADKRGDAANKTDGLVVLDDSLKTGVQPTDRMSIHGIAAPKADFFQPGTLAGKQLASTARFGDEEIKAPANKPNEPEKDQKVLAQSTEKAAETPTARTEYAQATSPTTPPPSQPQNPVPALQQRKIIRNGDMEFEVDSFDSTYMTISKIVTEEGGFVSSTNSEKLPNGKVRGTVIVRVPPDHLDTLVLKLRALGELKSQKISAQDVTKVYYDLDSELKAARAMEERLLNIIKSGKGEIKDLLEAEKQLGTYREKIEHLEGEIRYYNNLVSLSTLSITAFERDIRTPTSAAITEDVNMGVETEDVEKARTDALKAIDTAKGRIIESNLKKFDAGQFAATIVAEVPPDASGPLIDRIRQLGRVARLDVERKQTTEGGTGTPMPGIRMEKKDTRFSISIYNLANVAARQTTNLNIAVNNVEDAYRSIIDAVRGKNGRIVTSSLNRQKPEQTTASLNFEVPSADADATLAEIRRERDVMTMTVTENPDTNNVTSAKRGFAVQLFSLATVAPRQSEQALLAVRGSVPDAFRKLVDEAKKDDARVLVSQLNEQDKANSMATLEVEVPRTKEMDFRQAMGAAGILFPGTITRSPDAENTVDSKVRISLRILSVDRLAPRETQTIGVATKDVPASYQQLLAALQESGARIITSQLNEQNRSNITGTLDFEVVAENREVIRKALDSAGAVYSRSVTRSPDTVNTVEIKTRMQVTLVNEESLAPRERTHYRVEVNDVDKATEDLKSAALKAGGRVIQADHSTDEGNDRATGHVVVNVPLKNVEMFRDAAQAVGRVRDKGTNQTPEAPQGEFARAQVEVDLTTAGSIVSEDNGLGASVRHAMATSVRGLLWSMELILIGILIVGPWALILWGAWKVLRRKKAETAPVAA